ncbi:MAG: hypothetical protein K0R76_216 [Alphaproteobacteria bacterium]|jgi:hypothetical protein|nr:hypothetical protein [Alphaproteobacteria bacterium]
MHIGFTNISKGEPCFKARWLSRMGIEDRLLYGLMKDTRILEEAKPVDLASE